MKTEKTIGVGIIGASEGSWAVRSHLPALKMLDKHFTVTAVSTRNAETARKTADQFGIPGAFSNADDLINNPDVDLVVVAVKVSGHAELVEKVLAAGKMVYCEWPLGNGLKESKKLRDDANTRNVRTFCGLQSTSLPELRFLKAWLGEGNLGKVLATTVTGGGNNWGTMLPDESLGYLIDPANGATMLHIPFAHLLDGLQYCIGGVSLCSAFLARTNSEVAITGTNKIIPQLTNDQSVANAILADRVVAVIYFHGGEYGGENLRWEIYGTKGKLTITSPTGHLQFGKLQMAVTFGSQKPETLSIPSEFDPEDGGIPGYEAEPSRGLYYAYRQIAEDICSRDVTYPNFAYAVKHHELIASIEQRALRPESLRADISRS
ncbi:Gfo/Idh/MocA family protein [Mucilaginibacter litoreus]|uniref:Gfo/Idh/MocA family protein n=1 Tax=Mucilaginibacter litoreus TaxID=1048221 RepID=A0ABW3AX38_9SPHI